MEPPVAEKAESKESSKAFGLVNSSAAIHQDIRSMARKMSIEEPNV